MPEQRPLRLTEYKAADLAATWLTERDVERLHALQKRGALTVRETRGGWRISAQATVGVLVLDRVRLAIEPKLEIDGDQLIYWLAYALAAPVQHEPTIRRWLTSPRGYAELVPAALLIACQALLREGLHRHYVDHRRVEPVVRGRIDAAAQVTRRYGQLDQLHVRTFDRDADIWENRVLGTALRAAGRLASERLARALHTAAASFPADPAPSASLRSLERCHYSRVNARYRPAHTWARLVLRGGGVTDLLADEGLTAESLLLQMPRLWERVVRRLISDAAAPYGARMVPSSGEIALTAHDGRRWATSYRPDVLLRLPNEENGQGAWLPVDAKYKSYDSKGVAAQDVHQLLTYIAGYAPAATPTGAIVYPRSGGPAHRTVRVAGPRGLLGTIHVLGVGTAATPEQSVAWLRSHWPDVKRLNMPVRHSVGAPATNTND